MIDLLKLLLGLSAIIVVTLFIARCFGGANGRDRQSGLSGEIYEDSKGDRYYLYVDPYGKVVRKYLD